MGQVILKRTFEGFDESGIGRDRTLETYYVYDIYGNLTFVLPPKLSGQIPSNGILSQELIDALGYQYRYDHRNRLTEKKIPGKQKETILYDALNRIISTGPVSSPFGDNSVGTVHTKYDTFDRVVYTFWKQGIGANPFGIEPQVYLSESRTPGTSVINGVELSYSNIVQPKSGEILSVHYYDDYTYKDAPSPIPSGVGENNGISIKYNNNTVPRGLPTGSWTRVLETASQKQGVKNYTLYDKKARPVRVATFYPNNGKTLTDTDFNFIGDPNYTLTAHKLNANADEIKVKETYNYTSQSRLARVTHQINNLPAQILSVNSYDALGRLEKKKVGGTNLFGGDELQVVDYKYNIRGWLTDINNINNLNGPSGPVDLFAFRLNYNTVTDNINGQVEPLYNGNISETFWRTATDNVRRKYGYSYDHQNRLKAAYFQLPGTVSPRDGSFNTAYSYDDNGNILSLDRYKGSSSPAVPPIEIDDLGYTYDNGNKLLKVSDATGNPAGFNRNGAGTNAQYTYDDFGNLKSDPYKKITNITYNHLNLPVKITFVGGETIAYTYLADGRKIKKNVQDSQSNTTATVYSEGFQYKNESLEFFPHAEGYVKATQTMNGSVFNYVYTHTDHLGNIRIKYTKHPQTGDLKILEENHYYPYGLTHSGYNEAHLVVGFEQPGTDITLIEVTPDVTDPYRYKFGGKEYQEEFDVNMYDFGARNYDPALGRWMNLDPLAEQMRRHSPYNYAFDNPIYFIDPDGMMPRPPSFPIPIKPMLALTKSIIGALTSNSKKESQSNNSKARERPRSSGVMGVGIEFQGNKDGIAEIPIAERGTKVFTADGEPILELTNAHGPSLPKGGTALTPDGEGFSEKNKEPVEPTESFEIIYTVEGEATSGSLYGSASKEKDRGIVAKNQTTTELKEAERDSAHFVTKDRLIVPGTVRIRRDTIPN